VITNADLETLNTFLRQYEKLGDTELGRAGLSVTWDIHVGPSGASSSVTRPTNAQIIELLSRFRPFWAQSEPARFDAVHNVLMARGDLEPDERESVIAARARWKEVGVSSPFKIAGRKPGDWIRMFFNADVFHPGTPQEQAEQDNLIAQIGDDFGKYVLVDAVIEHIRPVIALAIVADRVKRRSKPTS